ATAPRTEGQPRTRRTVHARMPAAGRPDISPRPAIEPRDLQDSGQVPHAWRPTAKATEWTHREACRPDPVRVSGDASRHEDLEAGAPRGAREVDAVRPEVPILGDEQEQPRAR